MSSRDATKETMRCKPLTQAEAQRILDAALSDTKQSQQDKIVSEPLPAEPAQQEVAKRLESATTNESHSKTENSIDLSSSNNPPRNFRDEPEHNTMSYPYSRYNDEADVEAHVNAFLTTWQANHVS